jgi:hypothetical protein
MKYGNKIDFLCTQHSVPFTLLIFKMVIHLLLRHYWLDLACRIWAMSISSVFTSSAQSSLQLDSVGFPTSPPLCCLWFIRVTLWETLFHIWSINLSPSWGSSLLEVSHFDISTNYFALLAAHHTCKFKKSQMIQNKVNSYSNSFL